MTAANRPDVLARFWAKVDKNGPVHPTLGTACWLWTACKSSDGYGLFRVSCDRSMVRSHQFAFRVTFGKVPDGLELDHLCRVRSCSRPDHLEPVTHLENVARGDLWKVNTRKTHCPQGHPYDEANTRYRPGSGHRRCRRCSSAKANAYNKAHRERHAAIQRAYVARKRLAGGGPDEGFRPGG